MPIGQTSASGQASRRPSRPRPRSTPASRSSTPTPAPRRDRAVRPTTVVFAGAQQLTPPSPPAVAQGVPTHIVHHLYYDPADYNGNAAYTLPFDVSGQQGVSGYLLDRAPAHSLFIADLKRRADAPGCSTPTRRSPGRADLQTWIEALPAWLAAYNQRNGTSLTQASVLSDAGGQRGADPAFLRRPARRRAARAGRRGRVTPPAFAQLNSARCRAPRRRRCRRSPTPSTATASAATCTACAASTRAGARSARTPSVGPIYTRTVRPSRAPVLYKVTAAAGDGGVHPRLGARRAAPTSPATSSTARPTRPISTDLRWFGSDTVHPADPSTLAQPQLTAGVWQPLSLTAGVGDPAPDRRRQRPARVTPATTTAATWARSRCRPARRPTRSSACTGSTSSTRARRQPSPARSTTGSPAQPAAPPSW